MFSCFPHKPSKPSSGDTPESTAYPKPWYQYYNETDGVQLFYNQETKVISYLNPNILKEIQEAGKTGKDAVVEMTRKNGEKYGVDYGVVPEGKMVWQSWMPRELEERLEREKGGEEKLELSAEGVWVPAHA